MLGIVLLGFGRLSRALEGSQSFIRQRCLMGWGGRRLCRLRFSLGGGFCVGLPLGVLVVELQRWFFTPQVLVKILAGIMTYVISLFLLGLVLGLVAVASNPSPYFGALSLVGVAAFGCGVLI